jgi:hypothetical protein
MTYFICLFIPFWYQIWSFHLEHTYANWSLLITFYGVYSHYMCIAEAVEETGLVNTGLVGVVSCIVMAAIQEAVKLSI